MSKIINADFTLNVEECEQDFLVLHQWTALMRIRYEDTNYSAVYQSAGNATIFFAFFAVRSPRAFRE